MALMLGPQTLISKSTWPRYTKGLINLKPDIHQNIGDNQRKKKKKKCYWDDQALNK